VVANLWGVPVIYRAGVPEAVKLSNRSGGISEAEILPRVAKSRSGEGSSYGQIGAGSGCEVEVGSGGVGRDETSEAQTGSRRISKG
jgi:hypothetical protein